LCDANVKIPHPEHKENASVLQDGKLNRIEEHPALNWAELIRD